MSEQAPPIVDERGDNARRRGASSGRNAKAPAFQLYPADYLTDEHYLALSKEQRGIFWDLLGLIWLNPTSGVRADVAILARANGYTTRRFARLWNAGLSLMFEVRDGLLVNRRLERERQAQAANRQKRLDAGKLGNAAKAEKRRKKTRGGTKAGEANASVLDAQCDPADDAMRTHCEYGDDAIGTLSSLDSRTSESQKAPSGLPPTPTEPKRVAPRAAPVVDWAQHPTLDTPAMRVAWETWIAHRRELRVKPYTSQGLALALAKLSTIGPERALVAIQHSIASNWQGIYEAKDDGPRGPRASPAPENSTRAWLEEQARERPRTVDVEGRRTA